MQGFACRLVGMLTGGLPTLANLQGKSNHTWIYSRVVSTDARQTYYKLPTVSNAVDGHVLRLLVTLWFWRRSAEQLCHGELHRSVYPVVC